PLREKRRGRYATTTVWHRDAFALALVPGCAHLLELPNKMAPWPGHLFGGPADLSWLGLARNIAHSSACCRRFADRHVTPAKSPFQAGPDRDCMTWRVSRELL